ncbi:MULTISPECIES: copper chaperone CopZ [Brevibacillus]|jgi:copper chaperone|uniref:Copper chaperone CopZ n=2 Tax=Brevibacillus brevis TaxID=1393 RepID=C0ZBT7_BREBN|nr:MULTISPECIES: copper chaperone CopZ [Brevibacillus]MED1918243.1 copper chaperone CopZ [Bacillus thuringiensis]AWX55723.1 heavy-metal-associated domain-containing protein [Brevibacillus brevis]EJL24375.1 copper ion binding protein [Brevibacillus sp. BC25]NRR03287.1 copper chaperone CopZ [Brevibacillus sp. RS1.1]NRR20258.1 copper chaperone CopZ [Brevibacillus sp. MS2.2]
MNVTLNVQGMSCNHCVISIEGALQKLDGVSKATVSLADNQVSVTFDESVVSLDNVKETIEDQGYDVV